MMIKANRTSLEVLLGIAMTTLLTWLGPPPCAARVRPSQLSGAEPSRFVVSLKAKESCTRCPSGNAFVFEVRDRVSGATSTFTLTNLTSRVTRVSVVGVATAVVLGSSPGGDVVSVVALPSGKTEDQFLCGGPSLSPDGRFLAFVKWRPSHFPPGVDASDEYLVYDLTRSAEYNRPQLMAGVQYDAGWPVYPPGATNARLENVVRGAAIAGAHTLVSPLSWLDRSDVLAFVDRSQGVNRLVLADVGGGVRRTKVTILPLDTSRIIKLPACRGKVAPSDFENWSRDPGRLIVVTHIEISPDDPRMLRLTFSPQPCLAVTTLDVRSVEKESRDAKQRPVSAAR